ncbi:hypothetical protein EXN66_Car009779 [Channa argus]|uniref:Uncharacterized protein n=1 Tax=Channa argus TaxID=215402 RepID=A0A6G1PV94_CHAAH|nr:hypothetical protein EXN66_Car009779 [Channa argus]
MSITVIKGLLTESGCALCTAWTEIKVPDSCFIHKLNLRLNLHQDLGETCEPDHANSTAHTLVMVQTVGVTKLEKQLSHTALPCISDDEATFESSVVNGIWSNQILWSRSSLLAKVKPSVYKWDKPLPGSVHLNSSVNDCTALNCVWDSLIVQLCDLFEECKAEQSVLHSDLSNSADKSISVNLIVSFQPDPVTLSLALPSKSSLVKLESSLQGICYMGASHIHTTQEHLGCHSAFPPTGQNDKTSKWGMAEEALAGEEDMIGNWQSHKNSVLCPLTQQPTAAINTYAPTGLLVTEYPGLSLNDDGLQQRELWIYWLRGSDSVRVEVISSFSQVLQPSEDN